MEKKKKYSEEDKLIDKELSWSMDPNKESL